LIYRPTSFLTWTGCTSSNASTCTVLLNQVSGVKAVTAAFGPLPPTSVSVGASGLRAFGPHTVTITAVYTHTFTISGTYSYYCYAHRASGMVGTIVVNPPE